MFRGMWSLFFIGLRGEVWVVGGWCLCFYGVENWGFAYPEQSSCCGAGNWHSYQLSSWVCYGVGLVGNWDWYQLSSLFFMVLACWELIFVPID